MKQGQRPTVYGDGTQERDFIYIDDVVDQILRLVKRGETGVYDIGVGRPISFNHIIQLINDILKTDLKPNYIDAPQGYSKGLVCQTKTRKFTPIYDGIRKILLEQ